MMMPKGTVLLFIAGLVFLFINTASSQICTPACTNKQYCGTNSTGHALCLSCNAGCNGCTAGGGGNCKACADRYYNDTSSLTCKACDNACTECTGGARTLCKACDLGYQLMGTTCQACVAERFGENCTGICRCLNVEKCRDTDGRCDDWTCQWGWTNPPYCNRECSNKFGINCENECHCPVNDTCDKINGACGSNKCAEGYAGAGCQTELPKLRIPPIVKDNECGNVTIEWNAWSTTEDIGVGPVAKYNVYYKHNNMSFWVSNNTWGVVDHVDTTTRYTRTVTGFDVMLLYQFRVDVIRKDGDKISKDITSGYPTDPLQLSCPENVPTTTVAPTTVTPLQPPPDTVFRDFQVTLSDFTVYVNWSLVGNVSGIIIDNVTLYYGVIRLEDCPVFVEPNYTAVYVADVNSWTSPDLLPWRRYEVKIVVETAYNASTIKKENRGEIQTPEAEPTGRVTQLKVVQITARRASASWQDPECGQKGGPVTQYGVSYQNLNDTGAKDVITSIRFKSYDFNKLNPYTVYSFTVRYVNKNGRGPWSSEVYFTTAEAAPSAPAITNLTPGVNNVIVKWTAPSELNGIIREYMVFYGKFANFSDEVQKSVTATSFNIAGLLPFQTYYFKVKARTTPGLWGNFSETKNVTTLEDIPSAPASVEIVSRNESCLGVVWSAPLNPNGNIVQYKIRHAPTPGEWSSAILFPPTVNSADVCNLLPYRNYMIEVSASTSRGFGPDKKAINMTEIGTPPIPPPPSFINITGNRIAISINPVVISTGPLVSYKIYVHDISVNLDPPVVYPGYLAAIFPAENISTSRVFIVGDGKTYGEGVNKELVLNHRYDIYLLIESSADGITKNNTAKLSSVLVAIRTTTSKPDTSAAKSTNGDNTAVIIAVVVIILLLLIAAIIIGIIIWYRRRNSLGKYTYQPYVHEKGHYQMEPVMDDYDPHKHWNTIYSNRESRYITAGRELLPDEPVIANGTLGQQTGLPPVSFSQEFHDLPHGQLSSWNAAVLRKNAGKNRFPHLLPYDHTRVVLQPDEHARTDYINANHIHGFKRPNTYIAAQSPFDEDTVLDFWRMLYQKNVKIVVMITNLVEDRIVKCTQYWPDPEQGKVKYGGFLLELVDIRYFADYIIRTVKVKEKNNSKQKFVFLFEFCSWPDHGVPDDPIPLLEMRNKVCEYQGNDTSPLLVHCGTGVSRTGTYIAIDSLLRQYEADGRISVFSCVRRLRKDRVAMVRTAKQYVFIYETIFEARVAGDCRTGADLKDLYHILTMKNPKTKRTYLRDQFAALQRYTRKVTPKQCSTALSAANVSKNRFSDVVPSDVFRPVLDTPIGYNETDYVNAVFLDSHKQRNHFIITQTPLHTTVSDFWKLVYDMDVSTVVMMETYNNDDDTCAQYWPEHCVKKYEPFFVDNTEVYQQDNVTIRHFKVTNMHYPRTPARDVRQFQFNAWDDPEFVPKSKTMLLDLISQINDWQTEANNNQQPVIVHCKDGATHSGLFCAASVICEAMHEDGNVDLFHTVKHMKRRRTQIVDMLDQYRFCYKVLWDFMNLRMEGGTLTNMMNHTSSDPLYVGSLSLPSYVSHLEYM